MGCGIKAYYEDMEEERWERRFRKFSAVDLKQLFNQLEHLEEYINILHRMDLHLTKTEWSYMNSIQRQIKDILQ